ncbi:MAG: ATP synthase F0 subunit B [Actinomycetota bacterium]|nr:ATP synthase F0 subunit B [Actinomycetota bacterium]
MLTAVVTVSGASVDVLFPSQEGDGEETEPSLPESDLNPIAPEPKELAWGFGAFVVFALLMRFFLYPRLRKGMDARYQVIRDGHDQAEQATEAARGDVADYEVQVTSIKAEAAERVDAARRTLESERSERLDEVNARIGERRAAAQAEMDAARQAASAQVESAVAEVATRASELATGRTPDPELVRAEVTDVVGSGATR